MFSTYLYGVKIINYALWKSSYTRRILSSCQCLGFEDNGSVQEAIIFSTEEHNVELALIFLLLPLYESIGI